MGELGWIVVFAYTSTRPSWPRYTCKSTQKNNRHLEIYLYIIYIMHMIYKKRGLFLTLQD